MIGIQGGNDEEVSAGNRNEISAHDRIEIMGLIAQYSHTFDARDGAAFGKLFWEDGQWAAYSNNASEPVLVVSDRLAIEAFATNRIEMFISEGVETKHFLLNTVLTVESPTIVRTKAMALITWQRPEKGDLLPMPVQSGYYVHRIEKRDDVWKFARIEARTSGKNVVSDVYGSN